MDITTMIITICIPVALGGVLVLLAVLLTGFLSFKLKRDAGESFFNTKPATGDAFVIDDLIDGQQAKPRKAPFTPLVEEDVAAQILSKQTNRFLEQLAMEKAAEKPKEAE